MSITKSFLAHAALLCVLAATTAAATGRDLSYPFDTTDQLLTEALKEYAQTTDQSLIFTEDLVAGVKANVLKGHYTAEVALAELLKGTGLIAVKNAAGALQIRRADSSKSTVGLRGTEHAASPSTNDLKLAQTESAGQGNQPSDAQHETQASELDEIVVTAQKREERLQDVPISMSVLSGTELDRSSAEGISELLNRVPGVTTFVGNLGAGTSITVRGVTGGLVFGGSSAVAYYLDSVPFGFVRNGLVPDSNVFDLDRVEVLRGPQGTLYGANAMNGVVRILTKEANPDEVEFKLRSSAATTEGGRESYRGDLAFNVPIIEGKLAARAVLGYQDLGGWIDKPNEKDVNDGEIGNARFKLNAQPTEQLSLGLSAWLSRADYGAPPNSDDGGQRYGVTVFDEPTSVDYDVYSFKLGYDFSGVTVHATTGYIDYVSGGDLDIAVLALPGFYLFSGFESEVFSQEVTLASNQEGPWRWTAGGMYRDGEDRLHQYITQDVAPGIFQLDFGQSSRSTAIFGELTRMFQEGRYELTAGLRYFRDDVGDTENALTSGATPPLLERADSFDALTPRVVLTWHPNPQMTLYGSYSEGFRSGFNQWALVTRIAPQFPSVEPDTLKNYEIGAKGTLWDDRISFDTALYYIDWQDMKQGRLVLYNNIHVSAFLNAQSASGVGVDVGITVRPTDRLELGLNINWNDLKIDQNGFDSFNQLVLAKGSRPNGTPDLTGGASAAYHFPLGSGGFLGRFSASANYISELGSDALLPGDPTFLSRASFSIDTPQSWTAMFFVDNVTNRDSRIGRDPRNIPDWDTRMRPRTIGVQVEYRFGR